MYRPKFKVKSASADRKTDLGMSRGSSKNLSPSQKIIREYKRSELNKYSASPCCSDSPKTSTTEWQVLYTTQLTQKAKKFHDGILKLSECGSQRRQVFLYNESGRLLDNRFLKSDENIRSGESLKLDGHLVEIGDLKEDNEPLEESKLIGSDFIVAGGTEIQNQQVQTQTNYPEWDAMYTTQVTQRSKKYHSGILKLVSCGSYRMQVTLLAEDGTTLSHRYLKFSEHLSSGSQLEFPNYLVEVGEPRKHHDANLQNKAFVSGDKASLVNSCSVDTVKISNSVFANKFYSNEPQSKVSPYKEPDSVVRTSRAEKIKESRKTCIGLQSKDLSWKEPDSVVRSSRDDIKPSKETSMKMPLRDVHAILSFLKKPATQEGIVSIKREFPEEGHTLQTSNFVHLEIQNSVQGQQLVGDSCGQCSLMEGSDGKIGDIVPSDTKGDPELKIHTSSAFALCDGTILAPQIIDDGSDFQPSIVSMMHDGSNGKDVINNNQESTFSKASSRINFGQSFKEVKSGNLSQLYADNLGTGSRCNEAFDPCNVDRNNLSTTVTDEFPSFDLGF